MQVVVELGRYYGSGTRPEVLEHVWIQIHCIACSEFVNYVGFWEVFQDPRDGVI